MATHDENLKQVEKMGGLVGILLQMQERHFPPPVLDSHFSREVTMPRPRKNKPGYVEPKAQPYCGIRTAMAMLKLSKTAVVKLIDDGFIPSAYQADKPGGVWIMLRSEVEQIQKERKSNRV